MKAKLETIGDCCEFLVYRATVKKGRRVFTVEDATAEGAWSLLGAFARCSLEPADEETAILLGSVGQ